jgi:acetyl esterase/lipase
MSHLLFCELSKTSGARILSINFRLAPQNPFPAALCDALATYLYLMNPPSDSGFKSYSPEQIVLCGDSSGGGLAISLGLALRDLGLPLPSGIIGLSPWLDFTHSMPSFSDPDLNDKDNLQAIPGFSFAKNPNSIAYNEFRTKTENIIRNIQQHPEIKLIGDDSLKRIGNQSISFYMVNEGFGIPYVSPMLAESLGGLPPILIIAGNVEILRDEAIYFAYRASNPEKYRLPKYEIDFDNSQFKSPSKKIVLELYDEMFHNFQYFPIEASNVSIRRAGEFISNVIQEATLANPTSNTSNKFETYKITCQGEVQDLDESSIEHVLKWDKAGVFPGV